MATVTGREVFADSMTRIPKGGVCPQGQGHGHGVGACPTHLLQGVCAWSRGSSPACEWSAAAGTDVCCSAGEPGIGWAMGPTIICATAIRTASQADTFGFMNCAPGARAQPVEVFSARLLGQAVAFLW